MKVIGRKILAALACGVVLLTGLAGCSDNHGSPEAVARAYIEAAFKGDGEGIGRLMQEDALREEYYVYHAEDAYAELEEDAQNALEKMNEQYGNGWKFSYTITDVFEERQATLEYTQEVYNEYGVSVEECQTVDVIITVEGNGTSRDEAFYIPAVKIDGRWYLDIENGSMDASYLVNDFLN